MSGKVQVVLAVATAVFWGAILAYTLVADPGDPPGYLDDRSYPAAAEQVCAAAMAEADSFGNGAAVDTIEQRADLVDDQDVVFRQMLDDLGAIPRPEGEQGGWVAEWLGDWSTHVGDRERWSARLHEGSDPPFVETPKEGDQVSEAVDHFADTNEMPSCATLNDV